MGGAGLGGGGEGGVFEGGGLGGGEERGGLGGGEGRGGLGGGGEGGVFGGGAVPFSMHHNSCITISKHMYLRDMFRDMLPILNLDDSANIAECHK